MTEDLSRPRILIVDDQKTNIDILIDILSDCNRRIALSGEQALKIARSGSPLDLILLDIMMPGMDGYEVCRQLKADERTKDIAIIFVTAKKEALDEKMGFDLGAVDYITKPFNPTIIRRRVETQFELKRHRDQLQQLVVERTRQLNEKVKALEETKVALRLAMKNLQVTRVTHGVFWLQIPEADLHILCGSPGEIVKHLMRKGFINTVEKDGVSFENGPNVILLSDMLVQNGEFANLSEFPVLQMLYRQGMILPGHPGNTGVKPMLIGSSTQVSAQMAYIHRGKHGLINREELMANGVDEDLADMMMRVKHKFTFGPIQPPEKMLDTLVIGDEPVTIRNGVSVERIGFNRFRFFHRDHHADIDLNLPKGVHYEPPVPMGDHRFKRQFFAVLHTGEGDGWDINRRSMSSIVIHRGRIYLIDAGPGMHDAMMALGINISEVEGIFHTHGHDDHFAGLPALIHSDHRLKYYATGAVRASVAKKFAALMFLPEEKFSQFFEVHDLALDQWNMIDGLEVMPIYSPHPTETNLFTFRARKSAEDPYRSYAHWADLSAFSVMDDMVGDGPDDLPAHFIEAVKKSYLKPADLKKIDIGGGQIHGLATDFADDPSRAMILSHHDRELTSEEMEIGSESSFGAMDTLIPGNGGYLHERAEAFLKTLFGDISQEKIKALFNNCPMEDYNAGTIIHHAKQRRRDEILMVVTGTVLYLESFSGIRNSLSFGSLIATENLFERDKPLSGTFRTATHCSILTFPADLFLDFLKENSLLTFMEEILEHTWFLRRTWLFGEQTTFLSLGQLVQTMKRVRVEGGATIDLGEDNRLWLVIEGRVKMVNCHGKVVDNLTENDFFGEHGYFSSLDSPWHFVADGEVKLCSLSLENVLDIPIVHWKMLEIFEKRKKSISSGSA